MNYQISFLIKFRTGKILPLLAKNKYDFVEIIQKLRQKYGKSFIVVRESIRNYRYKNRKRSENKLFNSYILVAGGKYETVNL